MWYKKLNYLYFREGKRIFGKKPHVQYYWAWQYHGQTPIGLHQTMFITSVDQFSNDEQRNKWLPKALNFDISGCYAQTEIGHGSNVSGLETKAVFDKETDEFVLNTPTISATKWWPGELGRMANHALVMARLIIKDDDGEENDYGVCPFIVQIRDMDTHRYMPGCECGDMGRKLGYHSKDNGWLTLTNVRIPRNQMLQRFISVDREGSVTI